MQLPGTTGGEREFTAVLKLSGPAGSRPVTFFDVAGEDFPKAGGDGGVSARFLVGASALIFVHSVPDVRGDDEDATFSIVLGRLRNGRDRSDMPVAVAITKSDRHRYVPIVDKWLRHSYKTSGIDPEVIRSESRDAYSYLLREASPSVLAPTQMFSRCSLHFTSATGGEVHEKRFHHGVHPSRVLEPLVSILAMAEAFPSIDPDGIL